MDIVLQRIIDCFTLPFSPFGEAAQVAGASCIAGILFLLAYGKLSFQSSIRSVKRRIHASLLETIVFRHEPKTCLAAQGRMFFGGLIYFLLAVPPVLVLAVPFLLLASELQVRYGYQTPAVNEALVIRALVEKPEMLRTASLKSPSADLEVVGPVRAPATKEIFWRVAGKQEGVYPLALSLSGKELNLDFTVGKKAQRIEPYTYSDALGRLLYTGQSAVRKAFGGTIRELELNYPSRTMNFWGWQAHWFIPFVCISILAGLAGSKLFRIAV